MVVREYDAALGQHRLLFVVFGHFAAGVSEILLDAPQALLIGYQRQAEDIGHGFTGQIVLRRSQSPGQQHEVAAAHRQAQHLPQTVDIVSDRGLVQHPDPVSGKLTGQELAVGIDDIPQQQLRTNT